MSSKAIPIHWNFMLETALKTRLKAYVPVSGYQVGASVQTRFGAVYGGCNIEDVAFTSSLHAEQTAVANMRVQEGPNGAIIKALVVVAASLDGSVVMPCGHCRQYLYQFIDPVNPVPVRAYSPEGQLMARSTLQKLLPYAFSGKAFIEPSA